MQFLPAFGPLEVGQKLKTQTHRLMQILIQIKSGHGLKILINPVWNIKNFTVFKMTVIEAHLSKLASKYKIDNRF